MALRFIPGIIVTNKSLLNLGTNLCIFAKPLKKPKAKFTCLCGSHADRRELPLDEIKDNSQRPKTKDHSLFGNLGPRPKKEWRELARKVEKALSGQGSLFEEEEDEEAKALAKRVKEAKAKGKQDEERGKELEENIQVLPDNVEMENSKEAGSVYGGDQFWKRLCLDEILHRAGLDRDISPDRNFDT